MARTFSLFSSPITELSPILSFVIFIGESVSSVYLIISRLIIRGIVSLFRPKQLVLPHTQPISFSRIFSFLFEQCIFLFLQFLYYIGSSVLFVCSYAMYVFVAISRHTSLLFRSIIIFFSHLHAPSVHVSLPVPSISFPFPTFRRAPAVPTLPPSIRKELHDVARHPLRDIQYFTFGIGATIIFLLIPYSTYQWLLTLPNPLLLARRDLEVSTKIFDRNGILLFEIYTDQNRTPLPLSKIPKIMAQATLSIEDKDFYRHSGFSIKGMARATKEIYLNKKVQGGSTITQQLIKSALLTPDVKITRKIKEVILAFWAEQIYTKDQILEMYLNQVPYGGTAWGVESAARTYFGKSIADVTLSEAALLAGLPAAPSDYSPFGTHPEKAFERQAEVLRRMQEDGYITKDEQQKALQEQVHFSQPRVSLRAPHFVMYIKDVLERQYGPRLVERGGLRVTTSLDILLQEKAQEIVRSNIEKVANLQVGNGAALVSNPKNGDILAMVGSKNYFDTAYDGNVNITTSLRQPGSSIKVLTYALALENGFTAASLIDDSPISFPSPGGPSYTPVNYDGKFHGSTPLRYALGNSYNIPAVKLAQKLGVDTIVNKGKLMGIDSWNEPSRYGLSITLGGAETTMLDMAEVFGTLSNSGSHVALNPILEITDYTGKVYEKKTTPISDSVFKPDVAWIMSNMLSDNNARTSAFGPVSQLVIPGKTVSVKTGTSNEKRDNWTIGYTPSFVTTVWVGNNDNTPMNQQLASGVTGAAPIWHDIMVELLKDKPDEIPVRPESIVSLPCYFGRPEYFVKGTEPTNGRCAPIPTISPSPSPTP